MWLLAASIFAALKLQTWLGARGRPAAPARRLGYLLAWPGLDADAFLAASPPPKAGGGEWLAAALKTLAGTALVAVASLALPSPPAAVWAWVGMSGLILALHCGLFHLLSCAWRAAGVAALPLMDSPLLAASLSEFWGRRWNRAFRDWGHRSIFGPLRKRLGARAALLGVFLASGLIHDLVISVPAGGGYGGPTLYFLIQAAGAFAERSRWGRRLGLASGAAGRAFTVAALLFPVGLLFHSTFIDIVAIPFLEALSP
jgi:alginate O-acetyltransferase complex protein AlgI